MINDVAVVRITENGGDCAAFLNGRLVISADPGDAERMLVVDEVAEGLAESHGVPVRTIEHRADDDWQWGEIVDVLLSSGQLNDEPEKAVTALGIYVDNVRPINRRRVYEALIRMQGFSGELLRRHVWAEREYRNVSIDAVRQRVDLPNGCFYEFNDVTKTLVDYIAFLQRCAAATVSKPDTEKEKGAESG